MSTKPLQSLQSLLDLQPDPQVILGHDGSCLLSNKKAKEKLAALGFLSEETPNYLITWLSEVQLLACAEKNLVLAGTTWHIVARWCPESLLYFIRFELHQQYRQTVLNQHYDPLTQLPNHLIFKQSIKQYLEHAKIQNMQCAVFLFDVERLKDLNTRFGFEVGDQLLKMLAERILMAAPSKAIVARVSGNEFAVLIQDIETSTHVDEILLNMEKQITMPFLVNGQKVQLNVRVGLAISDQESCAEVLLDTAHAALNQARIKRKAKQLFCSKLQETLERERRLIEDFVPALEKGQFELYYEPRIDLPSNQIKGAEALLRWLHPDFGLINPTEFIPLAEKTGFIVQLGEWVMQSVFATLSQWQRMRRPMIEISLNLSAAEFNDLHVLRKVESFQQAAPELLPYMDLEITENLLLDNMSNVTDMMARIHQLGVKISIDDFGTGYSSLSYLSQLAVDKLKIDKVFIRNLEHEPDNQIIVKTIIHLAQQLNLVVCAEGVETPWQLDFVRNAGCHQAQGYYFHRPMPRAKFEQLYLQSMMHQSMDESSLSSSSIRTAELC